MTSTQLLKPVADGLAKSHPGYSNSDLERAYVAAEKAHSGQLRKSGEPYITHPVAVAQILTELGMDLPTIMAALLHDTVEDTSYSIDEIKNIVSLDLPVGSSIWHHRNLFLLSYCLIGINYIFNN